MLCKGFHLSTSFKVLKYLLFFFKYVLAFYSIRSVTMAHHGCAEPKVFDFFLLKKGLPRQGGDLSGYLVPALCISANSCYSGIALSIGMRSKSLTV